MEEANFLTRFADTVTIVHRRDAFRASKIMQERILKNPKIHVIWNSEVADILGRDGGEGYRRTSPLDADGTRARDAD